MFVICEISIFKHLAGPVYDVLSLVEKPGAQINLTTVFFQHSKWEVA